MQAIVVLALLSFFVLDQISAASKPDWSQWRFCVAPIFVLVGPTLLAVITLATARISQIRTQPRRLAYLTMACWCVGAFVLIGVVQWGRLVRDDLGLVRFSPLDHIVFLAPIIASLIVCWWLEHRLSQPAEFAGSSAWIERRIRRRYVGMKCQVYLVPALVPIGAVFCTIGLADTATYWTGNVGMKSYVALACLGLVLALSPWFITLFWPTISLRQDDVKQSIDEVSQERGFRFNDIRCWRTHQQLSNALVLGFLPGSRRLILTDRLLDLLTPPELRLVVAHEIAHVRLRHFLLRAAFVILPLVSYMATERLLIPRDGSPSATGQGGAFAMQPWWILWSAVFVVYACVVVSWISRKMEFEADLYACSATGRRGSGPIDSPSAEALGRTLTKLAFDSDEDPQTRGWLHPSIDQRVAFLQRIAENPWTAISFRHRFRTQLILLASAVVLSAALLAMG